MLPGCIGSIALVARKTSGGAGASMACGSARGSARDRRGPAGFPSRSVALLFAPISIS